MDSVLQHKVPVPNILEGRNAGYQLAPIYCNANAPDEGISPAVHAYHTHAARSKTGRIAIKNTHEGRVTMPNWLVAKYGADKRAVEDIAWATHRGTMKKHYLKVQACMQHEPN